MLGTNEHMKMPKGRKQTPHSQGAPRLVWGDRHEQIRGGDAEHIRWCKRNGGNRAEVPRVVREGLLERATPEPSPGGEGGWASPHPCPSPAPHPRIPRCLGDHKFSTSLSEGMVIRYMSDMGVKGAERETRAGRSQGEVVDNQITNKNMFHA